MEPVVGAVAEEERLLAVGALVEVVAELVVDGDEVLAVDLDAHLDAQVLVVVHVPGAGVADHLAVAGLDEQRALPERRGQWLEAERGEEALAVADHLLLVDLLRLQQLGEVVAGAGGRHAHEGIDVAPLLGPDVAEEVRGDRGRFSGTLPG